MKLEVKITEDGVFLRDTEKDVFIAKMENGLATAETIISCAEEVCRKVNSVYRRRLPDTRDAVTCHFEIRDPEGTQDGYITVGLYPEGGVGEIFLRMSKAGSTIHGLLDSWAITMSLALQHGVPLKALTDKLSHMRFEPAGYSDSEFGFAKSPIDYVARWLAARYLKPQEVPHPSEPDSTTRLSDHRDPESIAEEK